VHLFPHSSAELHSFLCNESVRKDTEHEIE
jgi:hypothetical protein